MPAFHSESWAIAKFTATPEADPPALTILVQNATVNLDKIEIPKGVDVTKGYVSTVLHSSNSAIERQRDEQPAAGNVQGKHEATKDEFVDSSRAAMKEIEAFLAPSKVKAER